MKIIKAVLFMSMMLVAKANVLEIAEIQPLGPRPFTKKSNSATGQSQALDIGLDKLTPPGTTTQNEDTEIPKYEGLDLGQTIDEDLPKYRKLNSENRNLNITLQLLPSFNKNNTPNVFQTHEDTTDSQAYKQQQQQDDSIVQKPSGTLYVDSIHNFHPSSIPLRMRGIQNCEIEDGLDDNKDEDDIHQLSASQFGYPKSIVSKAIDDSLFKSVLTTLARLHYMINKSKQQKEESSHNRHADHIVDTEKRFGPFSEFTSSASTSNSFKQKEDVSHEVHDTDANYNGFSDDIDGDSLVRESNAPSSSAFSPLTGYQNHFDSFTGSPGTGDQFIPHLLEGSLFSSTKKANSDIEKVDNAVNKNNGNSRTHDNDNSRSYSNNDKLKTPLESSTSLQNNPAKTSKVKSYFIESESKQLSISGKDSEQKQTNQNPFSKYFSDVSGGNTWTLSSNDDYGSYQDVSHQRSYPYQQRGDTLSGMMKSLFPPKKTESLPEISGLNDLIPKSNPVGQYSNNQKPQVGGPFDINIQSILGSALGIGGAQTGSQLPDTTSDSVTSNNFDFLGGGSNTINSNIAKSSPSTKERGASPTVSEIYQQTNDHNEIRFAEYRTRTKRDTSGNDPASRDTCQATYNTLQQYQNHGGACFVVLPQTQAVRFATCPKSSCSGCSVNGGESRCRTVRVPIWVWAYCEAGPSAGIVAPDQVNVSVACSCEISYCRQIPLGRS